MIKRYAALLIEDSSGNILLGKKDGGDKYANPGGKAEKGEDIYQTAIRELKEETNLDVIDIKLIKVVNKKNRKVIVYGFKVTVDPNQKIDTSNDPDKEFKEGLEYLNPVDVVDKLYVPLEDNVLLQYYMEN
jgi:ADP-ribose pyrophosphatase YjhB (NUDIX family)